MNIFHNFHFYFFLKMLKEMKSVYWGIIRTKLWKNYGKWTNCIAKFFENNHEKNVRYRSFEMLSKGF